MSAKRHGVVLEFETPEQLLTAVREARAGGYTRIDAHSPFAVDGLAEALAFRDRGLPLVIFVCGVTGGIAAFVFQYFVAVIDYPLNVGGKPYDSWPAFVLVTFEFIVLGSALGAFLGMLVRNHLPQPYHPLFAVQGFERASEDRFFLSIAADDPAFDDASLQRIMTGLSPLSIQELPDESP